eukprot:NODE_27_length_39007_cov_1.590650.p24 type:complete len:177 gc:universal NODE_27_length_39007_cov_1.590650:4604-4074(-)
MEKYFEEAFRQAEIALNSCEVPIGCVFVNNGKIISAGHNRPNASKNATCHAEIVAIKEIETTDFENLELFVTVEPCIMCAAAMRKVKLKRVFFAAKNDRFGGCGSVFDIHDDNRLIEKRLRVFLFDEYKSKKNGSNYSERAINLMKAFYAMENKNAPLEKRKLKYGRISEPIFSNK